VSDAETEAFEVLKSWIVSEPKNAEAVLSYGWVAAKLNRELPQAMARVSEIEELYGDANLDPIRRTRGYLHFAMKNYEKAIELWQKVLEIDPEHNLSKIKINLCVRRLEKTIFRKNT